MTPAALREAEREALEALEGEIGALAGDGFAAANVSSAWHGVRTALTAYRDAVAARVRAEEDDA